MLVSRMFPNQFDLIIRYVAQYFAFLTFLFTSNICIDLLFFCHLVCLETFDIGEMPAEFSNR